MSLKINRFATGVILVTTLILAACGSGTPTPATPTIPPTERPEDTATAAVEATEAPAYPAPGVQTPLNPEVGTTPMFQPTLSSDYPGPGQEIATQAPAAQNPTQPPVAMQGYPAPENELPTSAAPTQEAYPGPGSETNPPAPTQAATGSPTVTAGQTPVATPVAAPTATPFPTAERVDLHATDPGRVKLASGKVQLVEFFAFWCLACREMAPVMNGLEDQYGNQVNFIYLDIDDPATAVFKKDLGYRAEPETYLLDGSGKVLIKWRGLVERAELEQAIQAALE